MKLDKLHIAFILLTAGLALALTLNSLPKAPQPLPWKQLLGPFQSHQDLCLELEKNRPSSSTFWKCYQSKNEPSLDETTLVKWVSDLAHPFQTALYFTTQPTLVDFYHHLALQTPQGWFLYHNISHTYRPSDYGIVQNTTVLKLEQTAPRHYHPTRIALRFYHYQHDNDMPVNQYHEAEQENHLWCQIENKRPVCTPNLVHYAHAQLRVIQPQVKHPNELYDHRLLSEFRWVDRYRFQAQMITDAPAHFEKGTPILNGVFRFTTSDTP